MNTLSMRPLYPQVNNLFIDGRTEKLAVNCYQVAACISNNWLYLAKNERSRLKDVLMAGNPTCLVETIISTSGCFTHTGHISRRGLVYETRQLLPFRTMRVGNASPTTGDGWWRRFEMQRWKRFALGCENLLWVMHEPYINSVEVD